MTAPDGTPPGPAPDGPAPRRRPRPAPRSRTVASCLVTAMTLWLVTLVPTPPPTAGPGYETSAMPGAFLAPLPASPLPPAPVPARCAPVTAMIVDGGSDSPLRPVVGALDALAPGLAVVDVPRPDPGTGPDAWPRQVRASLDASAAQCPATRFLVYAWSEGAAASTAALSGLEIEQSAVLPRVAGVALLGNPVRDPARQVVPLGVAGGGVLPGWGSLVTLANRTVEICAPTDTVCAAPGPWGPQALASALPAPAHRSYADLPTGFGDRTVTTWLAEAARQAVAGPAAPPAPGPPPPPPPDPGASLAGPAGAPGAALDALGLPLGDPPGLIWRAVRGGVLGFDTFKRNAYDEQSGSPTLVPSPAVGGVPALRFSVAAGGQRVEMQPDKPDPREGETQYIGFHGALAPDFPIQNERFQIIMQWHHPGPTGSPPLTVEVSNNEVRLTGGQRRPFIASVAPIRPGEVIDLVLRVTFSSDPRRAAISVWKDGQLYVRDARPPEGTLYAGDDSAYMKMGMYRGRENAGTATVYVHDVLVGRSYESVARAR